MESLTSAIALAQSVFGARAGAFVADALSAALRAAPLVWNQNTVPKPFSERRGDSLTICG